MTAEERAAKLFSTGTGIGVRQPYPEQVAAAIREAEDAAYERAAKICDGYDCTHGPGDDIRALKSPAAPALQPTPEPG